MVLRHRHALYILFFGLIACISGILALTLPEENIGSGFLTTGLEVIPFLLLIVLARGSSRYLSLRPVALTGAVLFVWLLALITWAMMIIPAIGGPEGTFPDPEDMTPGQILPLVGGLAVFIFTALLASLPVFTVVRRIICRIVPLRPSSVPHAVSMIIVAGLILIPVIPLLLIGQPVYLGLLTDPAAFDFANTVSPITDMYSLFWMIFIAFIAAGLFIDRNIPETLSRLGLRWPTLQEFLLASLFGLVLVPVLFLIDLGIQFIFSQFGIPVTDDEYYVSLFAGYLTPAGILAGSITAGFGEELAMRGLLQPRYGILLTSLVFATLHAFQYNFDGVLSVFLAGIIFGLLRNRWHTTFSATTHAVYDLVLMVMMMFGILTI